MTALLRRLTALILISLLAACGFHLRGQGPNSGFAYPEAYVDGNGGVAQQLRLYLPLLPNVKLVKDPTIKDVAKISIASEISNNTVLTINSSGQATEYLTSLVVTFSAWRPDGSAIMEGQQVTLSRSYSYDPNNPIAMTGESNRLVKDMQQDASQLILRRINAVATHGQDAR
ncbi:LPS-assembly lipoprotein LptE [Silvimonas amylolytica]|nr:LPS assembly lipoprotein LptE [Silvimonas amylolytica]